MVVEARSRCAFCCGEALRCGVVGRNLRQESRTHDWFGSRRFVFPGLEETVVDELWLADRFLECALEVCHGKGGCCRFGDLFCKRYDWIWRVDEDRVHQTVCLTLGTLCTYGDSASSNTVEGEGMERACPSGSLPGGFLYFSLEGCLVSQDHHIWGGSSFPARIE